jgi:hypothetical protein
MISRQLELGFENQAGLRTAGRRRGRTSRAHWWFEQMRGVVNHARDWPPADLPEIPDRPDPLPADSPNPSRETVPRTSALSPPGIQPPARTGREPRRSRLRRSRGLMWE